MHMFKLLLSALLIMVGMLLLPPLSGSGIAGLVSRLWLGFGLLVFSGHYLNYLQEEKKRQPQKITAGLRLRPDQQRNLKQKSFSGQ